MIGHLPYPRWLASEENGSKVSQSLWHRVYLASIDPTSYSYYYLQSDLRFFLGVGFLLLNVCVRLWLSHQSGKLLMVPFALDYYFSITALLRFSTLCYWKANRHLRLRPYLFWVTISWSMNVANDRWLGTKYCNTQQIYRLSNKSPAWESLTGLSMEYI